MLEELKLQVAESPLYLSQKSTLIVVGRARFMPFTAQEPETLSSALGIGESMPLVSVGGAAMTLPLGFRNGPCA